MFHFPGLDESLQNNRHSKPFWCSARFAPLILLLILLLCSCTANRSEFERILAIEDQRDPCQALQPFLRDPEPQIRTRALEAIARLQDSTCVLQVTKLLDDINHNVRIAAAFALGQTGSRAAEKALLERLEAKDLAKVQRRVLEAIGKIGGPDSYPAILKHFRSFHHELRAEAALSTARLAIRGQKDSLLTAGVTELLQDRHDEVRWKAAYALMRIGAELNPQPLRIAVEDPHPYVRMYAIMALGSLKDYAFIEPIGLALSDDPDWRVRVNAARAFAGYPLTLSANYLSLLGQQQQVRVAIINAIGQGALHEPDGFRANSRELSFARRQLEQVIAQTNGHETYSPAEREAALVAYARLMGEEAFEMALSFSQTDDLHMRARAMEAMGEIGSRKAIPILGEPFSDSAGSIVRIAALQALKKIKGPERNPVYVQALAQDDPVVAGLAAEGLAMDSLQNQIYGNQILAAYERLKGKMDSESKVMMFQAMANMKLQDALPVLSTEFSSDDRVIARAARLAAQEISEQTAENEQPLQSGRQTDKSSYHYKPIFDLDGARAVLLTTRGEIEIRLMPLQAPLTVRNFVKLAEAGFYDGLLFHRVVPNFVIQGGDPRGDGWGSPGYVIRSEFNKINFGRGTVGMASAGKDTEGSQFFITQSPQPHLDGRYTVFGQVVNGMNIVDATQQGDAIQHIEIDR